MSASPSTTDLTALSQTELAAYVADLHSKLEAVKSAQDVEAERLDAQYTEMVTDIASFITAYGEATETALWSGYHGKSKHVQIGDHTYTVSVSVKNVKRTGDLKAAAAAKKAVKA